MTTPADLAPTGFVALWNKTDAEYRATAEDEWATTDRVQDAFTASRARGNASVGLFTCRWGSPYAYMTFWHCPDMPSLVDSIADLERAGDFKFADSYHVFGARLPGTRAPSGTAADGTVRDSASKAPIGLFVQWHLDDRPGRAVAAHEEITEILASEGSDLAGSFDSRLTSPWERFAFAIATEAATERVMRDLRAVADRRGVVMRTRAGQLDGHYRFASHLQMERPWLDTDRDR